MLKCKLEAENAGIWNFVCKMLPHVSDIKETYILCVKLKQVEQMLKHLFGNFFCNFLMGNKITFIFYHIVQLFILLP